GLDALDHRAADLHGSGAEFLFHSVGAVVSGAALDRLDGGVGYQAQHVAGLEPYVLHAQMTGDVVGHLAERALEVGAQQARAMAGHEVLEGVEDALRHPLHGGIVGKHQRQLLLEHEHAGRDRRDDVDAGVDGAEELRDVVLLQARNRLEVPELQSGHAAAPLLREKRHGDVVVLEDGNQILVDLRVVAVAIAGGEERDLAGDLRVSRCARTGNAGSPARRSAPARVTQAAQALARRAGVILWYGGGGVDPQGLRQYDTACFGVVDGVDDFHDDGDAGNLANGVGGGQRAVAEADALLARAHGLRTQHQMREVDVPWMRRHVRTLRHEAHVAEIAVIDDLPEHLLVDRRHLARGGRIHGVEQCWKGVTEAEAATAAVTDVEDALELLREPGLVVEGWILPVDRVSGGRLEAALAAGGCRSRACTAGFGRR